MDRTGRTFGERGIEARRLVVLVSCWLGALTLSSALSLVDPTGDTTGPDLTGCDYTIDGGILEVRLTMAQELTGGVISQDLTTFLWFDVDRSATTGFRPGPGFHTRFGIDYEIKVELLGFGGSSNTASLHYWRQKQSDLEPYIERERVGIPLGNPFYPNGSVFVVGEDAGYGTDRHQILLRVPVSLFDNEAFPLCSALGPACINALIPCPSPEDRNPADTYFSVFVTSPLSWLHAPDSCPETGMIDVRDGSTASEFPVDATDLVAELPDPGDDGVSPAGSNGDELTGLRVFHHSGEAFSFELQLESYEFEDTAAYHVVMDLDNNPATGESFTHGAHTMGADLWAEFTNFDNPVGEANPLAGTLFLFNGDAWCPLNYTDYLATVWRSTPGYVYVTLPGGLTGPGRAANVTGAMLAFVGTANDDLTIGGFNDVIPNQGFLELSTGSAGVREIRVVDVDLRPGRILAIAFETPGALAGDFVIHDAPSPAGPWSPTPGATVSSTGGDRYMALCSTPHGDAAWFFRVVRNIGP